MQTAKQLRKRTKQHRRRQQAQVKIRLAWAGAVTQGMMVETEKYLIPEHAKEREQVRKVWRWSNACLDGLQLGKKSIDASIALVRASDVEVQAALGKGQHTIGHFAMVWLMIGYVLDDCARRYAPAEKQREWRYLASVVNTWAGMLLDLSPDDRDYEGQAGDLAERVWAIVIGRE